MVSLWKYYTKAVWIFLLIMDKRKMIYTLQIPGSELTRITGVQRWTTHLVVRLTRGFDSRVHNLTVLSCLLIPPLMLILVDNVLICSGRMLWRFNNEQFEQFQSDCTHGSVYNILKVLSWLVEKCFLCFFAWDGHYDCRLRFL